MDARDSSVWCAITALAARALAGDREGQESLWAALAPHVEAWSRGLPMIRMSGLGEDHARDIVTTTWERLQERDHYRLRLFFTDPRAADAERRGGADELARCFRAWLRVLVKRVGCDHVRALPEYSRPRDNRPDAVRWREIEAITTGTAAVAGDSERRAFIEEMLQFLDTVPTRRDRHIAALAGRGASFFEIANALGLADPAEAARLVGRATDRLAYRPALEMWGAGYDAPEIARALELVDAAHAKRVLKAAKACLSRRFAGTSVPRGLWVS